MAKLEIDERHESMRQRLNSRCKGLLEVSKDANSSHFFFDFKFDFLHRTVRDFFRTSVMRTMLDQYADDSFDVDLEVCKALLIQIKFMNSDYDEEAFAEPPTSLLKGFLAYARKYENHNGKPLTRLMDELDKASTIFWQQVSQAHPSSAATKCHWSNRKLSAWETRSSSESCFLTFSMAAGLKLYTKEKLKSSSGLVKQKQGRPLLDCALRGN